MTTVYEIPPEKMIEIVAKNLKNKVKLKKPEWVKFVKTGAHKEKMPQDDDMWWIRSASILRKVYINGPVGVQRLRTAYGGKKNRGVKPEKFYRASGKIIRTILQEFDKLGFTEKMGKGRKITPKGQSYLDKLATEFSRGSG
jgi:small subunit ribosomal protein S19e